MPVHVIFHTVPLCHPRDMTIASSAPACSVRRRGSKRYAAALTPAAQAKIRAVVHMDMIGSLNSASPTVLLEGRRYRRTASRMPYTGLAVQTSLNPFIENGVPAVLTIEGTDDANHNIHSLRDMPDRINFDLALDILRMNAAFAAQSLVDAAATLRIWPS
jgi:hypothetical protein